FGIGRPRRLPGHRRNPPHGDTPWPRLGPPYAGHRLVRLRRPARPLACTACVLSDLHFKTSVRPGTPGVNRGDRAAPAAYESASEWTGRFWTLTSPVSSI